MTQSGSPPPQSAPPGSGNSELILRLVTAAIGIPIVLLAAWLGGLSFTLIVAIAIGTAGYEWTKVCDIDRPGAIASMLVLGPVISLAFLSGGLGATAIVMVLFIGSTYGGRHGTPNYLWPGIGVIYLGVPAIAILLVRATPETGAELLLFLLGVVWLTDTGAYAFGRAIGGAKLAPIISPGKTWAGAIGGLVLAVAGGLVGAMFMETQPPMGAAALAIILSIATQVGDLFESWVKRVFGKKDAGTIMPGHGGVLDRIDGLLFAAPIMAVILMSQPGNAI